MPLLSKDAITKLSSIPPQLSQLLDQFPNHPAIIAAQKLLERLLKINDDPKAARKSISFILKNMAILDGDTGTMVPSIYNEATYALGKIIFEAIKPMGASSLPLFSDTPQGKIVRLATGGNPARFMNDLLAGLAGQIKQYEWVQSSVNAEVALRQISIDQLAWFNTILTQIRSLKDKSEEDKAIAFGVILKSYAAFIRNAVALMNRVPYRFVELAGERVSAPNRQAYLRDFTTTHLSGGRRMLQPFQGFEYQVNFELKKVGLNGVEWFKAFIYGKIDQQNEVGSLLKQRSEEFDTLHTDLINALNRYIDDFATWQEQVTDQPSEALEEGGGGGGSKESDDATEKVKPRNKKKKALLVQLLGLLERINDQEDLKSYLAEREQTLENHSVQASADPWDPLVKDKDCLDLVSTRTFAIMMLLQWAVREHESIVDRSRFIVVRRLSPGQTQRLLNHFLIKALALYSRTGIDDDTTLPTFFGEGAKIGQAVKAPEEGGGAAVDLPKSPEPASATRLEHGTGDEEQYKIEDQREFYKFIASEIEHYLEQLNKHFPAAPATPPARSLSSSSAILSATAAAAAVKIASAEAQVVLEIGQGGHPPTP